MEILENINRVIGEINRANYLTCAIIVEFDNYDISTTLARFGQYEFITDESQIRYLPDHIEVYTSCLRDGIVSQVGDRAMHTSPWIVSDYLIIENELLNRTDVCDYVYKKNIASVDNVINKKISSLNEEIKTLFAIKTSLSVQIRNGIEYL